MRFRGAFLVVILSLLWLTDGNTQVTDADKIADIVYLDSIVVSATASDFSVSDFIEMVLEDESFYQAFRNLRKMSHTMDTKMEFLDRKERISGSYRARHHQVVQDSCREMTVIHEEWNGDIRKKRKDKYRYYTATLYDRLFVYQGPVCTNDKSSGGGEGEGEITRHIEELKKLVFSPGSESNVPFIGKKTEIFSPLMRSHYDFHIRSGKYLEENNAYIFEARLRHPEEQHEKKTVVKRLITYFSPSDFQVLGREYELVHHTLLYDFEVSMDIRLIQIADEYYPEFIGYRGFWNIPFHRKEDGSFTLTFSGYEGQE